MTAMTDVTLPQVEALEERLAAAMRSADTAVLGELLADDVVFTNHEGRVLGKQDDLAVHASGLLKIDTLGSSDRIVRLLGGVAVVAVEVALSGRYGETPFAGRFRYTRVWARQAQGSWQVVAAHAVQVATS